MYSSTVVRVAQTMSSARQLSNFRTAAVGLASAFLLFGGACSKQKHDRVEVEYVDAHVSGVERAFSADGLLKESFDVHEDGFHDSWAYSLPLDEDGVLIPREELVDYRPQDITRKRPVRREIDVNGDGEIDLIRHYDEHGNVNKDEVDSNFDGSVDRVIYYRDGVIIRRAIDADRDGVFEEVRQYIKGEIFRVERDTNNDGQPDFWMFFKDGKLERAGVDLSGNLVIDEWLVTQDLKRIEKEIEDSEREEDEATPPSP